MIKAIAGITLLAAAALFAVVRRLTLVRVAGQSMVPTLADGARLLVWRGSRLPRVGDVVVLEAPYPLDVVPTVTDGGIDPPPWSTRPARRGELDRRWIVKRVAALPTDAPGHLMVLGDNPDHSFDSRQFGLVPGERVLGRVVGRRK